MSTCRLLGRVACLVSLFGARASAQESPRFDRLDRNGDGFVDRTEFARTALGRRYPSLFDQLDTSKDGKIPRGESNRVGGDWSQRLRDIPPARDVPASSIPPPARPGEPALKSVGDSDAVRDAAGRGQLFEAVHAAGFTNLRDSTNGIALVDINRDGWLDIVATHSPRRGTVREGGVERLRVLLNDGNWNFREHAITLKDSKVAIDDFGRGQVPVLADFNRDGFLDLFVTRNATMQGGRNISGRYSHGNSLFISDGAWDVFRDVSDPMGIRNQEAYNRQPSIGDVNQDGWLDIAIGCDNIKNALGGVPHSRLYIFQPKGDRFEDGTFKDIGGTDLVPDFGGFFHDSAQDKAGPDVTLHDLDGDGDLDLIQSCHVDVREPLRPYWPGEYRQGTWVWKNLLVETGSLRFVKSTDNGLAAEARLRYDRQAQRFEPVGKAPGLPSCSVADVNNDGRPDVLTVGPANPGWAPRAEYVTGRYWRNLGGFKFAESTSAAGLEPLNWTLRQRAEFFDIPLPRRLTNWRPAGDGKLESQPGRDRTNPLDGRPYFADAIFADYDNDSWIDLVVQDRSESDPPARATLFMNNGDGTFEVKPTAFSGLDANGICGVAGDLNNDGLVDLIFPADPDNSGVASDTSRYESRVYWNTGEHGGKQNHWLRMRFTGVTDAQLIGARVEAVADGRVQHRWIAANHSYKSGSPLEAHFGLAGSKSADINVTLPSGRTIALAAIAADQYVEIDLAKRAFTPVRVSQAASAKTESPASTLPELELDIAATVSEPVARGAFPEERGLGWSFGGPGAARTFTHDTAWLDRANLDADAVQPDADAFVETSHTLRVDGRERSFVVQAPSRPRGRLPVVFIFHGGGGRGLAPVGYRGMVAAENFLAVYPNGWKGNWNDGRNAARIEAQQEGVDDVKFVRAIVENLAARYEVDRSRIFATGVSNGGIFCHYLAANAADLFAAVAPIIGGLAEPIAPTFKPSHPISLLVIQGDADPLVPINGGPIARSDRGGRIIGTERMLALYTAHNKIAGAPVEERLPDVDEDDGCRTKVRRYPPGAGGARVEYWLIEGGGHTLPGRRAARPAREGRTGRTSRDFDAFEVVWEFFKTCPPRQGVGAVPNQSHRRSEDPQ
jgi:poly(3-hydroxybutyrate) depolymerase